MRERPLFLTSRHRVQTGSTGKDLGENPAAQFKVILLRLPVEFRNPGRSSDLLGLLSFRPFLFDDLQALFYACGLASSNRCTKIKKDY